MKKVKFVELKNPITIDIADKPETIKKIITEPYIGYLTGQIKEILEASIEKEKQCEALKNVITDKIYHWYQLADKQATIDN